MPEELSDISDLAPPAKAIAETEPPAKKPRTQNSSDLDLDDLNFDLNLDDLDTDQKAGSARRSYACPR